MKRNIGLTTLVFLVCTMFVANTPSAHAGQCSLAGVAGKYGLTLTGTLLLPTGPVPAGAAGKAILTAEGNVFGTEARNVGGGFANETFHGTITVNPDCTGATTIKFFESGVLVRTSVLSVVFDENMQELRLVQQSLTLPNGANVPVVITADAKKMFSGDEQN